MKRKMPSKVKLLKVYSGKRVQITIRAIDHLQALTNNAFSSWCRRFNAQHPDRSKAAVDEYLSAMLKLALLVEMLRKDPKAVISVPVVM